MIDGLKELKEKLELLMEMTNLDNSVHGLGQALKFHIWTDDGVCLPVHRMRIKVFTNDPKNNYVFILNPDPVKIKIKHYPEKEFLSGKVLKNIRMHIKK